MAALISPAGMNMGQAGLAIQGIGAIVGVMGAYAQAGAMKRNLQMQAELAAINAKTAEATAQSMLLAGQRNEQRSSIATANLTSTQITAFAANGIDLGEGSAARTLTSTDVLGEIDKNTIHANAVREAWGYRTNAVNYQNDALLKTAAGDAVSPGTAAGTSLMNSAGAIASSWYQLGKGGGSGLLGNGTGNSPPPPESIGWRGP